MPSTQTEVRAETITELQAIRRAVTRLFTNGKIRECDWSDIETAISTAIDAIGGYEL